jgi:dihydroflavonol-4-reductase
MRLAPSAPAFVTGGSGFVGGAVVRHLVTEGRQVRALARSSHAAARVAELGAVPVAGSLDDATVMADGMRGCSVVFHVAGVNSMCPRDPAPMYRVNVDGVAAVLRAAAEANVPRVIHTSSSAAIGEAHDEIGREDSPHRGRFLSAYERSKFLGEALARRLGPDLGLDVVVVNPSSVQGPGRETGTARLLLAVARARTALLVRAWFSVVDVDDCARGHLLADRHGIAGERYLLSGAALSTEEAVGLLRRELGGPRRVVWIPRASVRGVMPVAAIAALLDGPDPTLCPALLTSLLHGHRYDGSRATRDLGLEYRPVDDTLRRVVAWFRDRGLLRSHDRA